jgi:hypothetical protein
MPTRKSEKDEGAIAEEQQRPQSERNWIEREPDMNGCHPEINTLCPETSVSEDAVSGCASPQGCGYLTAHRSGTEERGSHMLPDFQASLKSHWKTPIPEIAYR